MQDNGSLEPEHITVGDYEALQYTVAYEGPQTLEVRVKLGDSSYIPSSFSAAGDEKTNANYGTYIKLLGSLKKL